MKDTLTYLGYRFTVEAVDTEGRRYIKFVPIDPTTPEDVIMALYRTANENVACIRKNIERVAGMSVEERIAEAVAGFTMPASAPCSSEPTTL